MDATHLKVWLPFDESATLDRCGGTWTTSGSPTIENGALKLNGSSYLKRSEKFEFTGQSFTVSCKFSGTSNTAGGAVALWQMYIGDSNRFHISINTSGRMTLWKDTDDTVQIVTSSNVLDGQIHHAECDFDGSTWYLFLDGNLIGSKEHTCTARTYTLYVGTNYQTGRKFTGSIDEFQIFDGVALHTTDFTPPTAADYDAITSWAVTANADVEVLIANYDPSSGYWRYENPGSGDYILNHNNINTETVGFDKSVTGVAFWGGDRNDMVGVPAGCKELWVRLDLFLDAGIVDRYNTTSFSFGSTSSDSASINLCGYSNLVWTLPEQNGWSLCIGNTMYFTLTPGKINSILLYLRSGKTDGMIQGTVSGRTASYTGNVNGGADFSNLFFTSSKVAALYSNIVASNAPLSLEDGWHREPAAVELNIKAVDLCVRKNGRTYAIPFSTTSNPPANSVVARVGRKTVYNPLVTTTDENASALKVRYNGEDRALSASFN